MLGGATHESLFAAYMQFHGCLSLRLWAVAQACVMIHHELLSFCPHDQQLISLAVPLTGGWRHILAGKHCLLFIFTWE